MKTQVELPSDIKTYIIKQCLPRFVLLFLLVFAVILIGVFYKDEIKEKNESYLILYFVILIPLCVVISGILPLFRDRTWCGTVRGVALQRKGERIRVAGSYNQLKFLHERKAVMLSVCLDNGESISVEAIPNLEEHERTMKGVRYAYKEGMRVLHVSGTKYVQIVPDGERKTINCVICGDNSPKENEACIKCGHTLHIMVKEESK